MVSSKVWICGALIAAVIAAASLKTVRLGDGGSEGGAEAVLNLGASNFSAAISEHSFIVVEFYAPWCGHCKTLAPEYEKAAVILSKHDPPIVLAKVDANNEVNKDLASKYDVTGFPTIKILRDEGKNIQEYKGPRDADGIVEYLKKQVGPASSEIKSLEDSDNLISDKRIFIVGVFPKYSGEEFENFMTVAEKMRSDYDFGHTLDAKVLPHGDSTVDKPTIRLFKPFDELFVDSQDFHVDALEKFIDTASVPVITTLDKDPINQPFISKFFNSPNSKAMLFLDFSNEDIDAFKSKYHEVADQYKGKEISFLIGNLHESQSAFKYFKLKEEQAPLILIQEKAGQKFLKPNLEPIQIALWFKEYTDGTLTPFKISEPIPEVNDEPVKIVVADSINDVVFNSGKNVLLEFYAPWCGHCKKLAPILEEVALSFKDDAEVIIAKMDATANDVPTEFKVQGYPTLYFSSGNGKLVLYDGGRTAADIIDYIKKNKDSDMGTDSLKDEL